MRLVLACILLFAASAALADQIDTGSFSDAERRYYDAAMRDSTRTSQSVPLGDPSREVVADAEPALAAGRQLINDIHGLKQEIAASELRDGSEAETAVLRAALDAKTEALAEVVETIRGAVRSAP